MKSRKVIGPVALGVLERIGIARAEHLRTKGEDLLWSEIGRQVGWGQPTTSAVKNGKRPVDIEELPTLAGVLRVRPAWLVFADGPMTARPTIDPETEAAFEEARRKHPGVQAPAKRGQRAG